MPAATLTPVLHYLRQVASSAEPSQSDGLLLERFARLGDAAAFDRLVRRHGPMVLGVCRRLLGDPHDADDAFQATFLLLVRKAGSLRRPEQLGPWLHGVARRTALKARALRLRRQSRARPLEDVPAPGAGDDPVWRDLRPVLDDAIQELPARYRAPVILCYLEGLTQGQAAERLGCPVGTVATRLSRARARLRVLLTRRGVAPSLGGLTAALAAGRASAHVPTPLANDLARVTQAVLLGQPGAVPAPVALLTHGVWKGMLMDKVKLALAVLLAVGAAGTGTGVWGYRALATGPGDSAAAPPAVVSPPPVAEDEPPRRSRRTPNFIVQGPEPRVTSLVAEAAERHRKELALAWLGKELPPWPEPCVVEVKVTSTGSGGATSFAFDLGKVKTQQMRLEGPLDALLASVLPHEVTHTILAHHFGAPVPRWADEGAAILGEDEAERRRHDNLARQLVAEKRDLKLARLLALKDYPPDVMVLFAQGYSVARFLVERKGRPAFLAFVRDGQTEGWDRAVQTHYGYESVELLQRAWLDSLQPEPAARGTGQQRRSERRLPPAPAPQVLLARVDQGGFLVVRGRDPGGSQARTAYAPSAGGVVVPATTVAPAPGEHEVRYVLKEVRAYDPIGQRIGEEELARRLTQEAPVLVAADGQMVDPFYLQVVKKGVIVLVLPSPLQAR